MFEFTFDSFSDEQRDAYLARIGFREETCRLQTDTGSISISSPVQRSV